ncbi:DUF3078 domain-containing protein [Maribellus sp. YY47]|uniref:DUF3078 domain-containing protein n=1 Tax=Maribellus sp. YY47 TaxID=2929486 RepID=UPI0020011EC9|nr:DUF3078 domain-containing protein [Maribellus sp. YY47]MCK3684768.1 DUF3078 domain-containing protein [Maribellus sp. YY47]
MKQLLSILLLVPFFSFAQEKKDSLWTTSGSTTLNFSQVSLSNWAAGGKSSMSAIGMINYAANYKKDNLSWDNTFDFRYGFLKEKDVKVRKSDDIIDVSSKLGFNAGGNWNYSGLVNFKSQFAKGYKYDNNNIPVEVISKFMAPAYLKTGIGMDYKNDHLSVLLAPVSGKFTFVLDDSLSAQGAFGVEENKNFRAELGATAKFEYKRDIMKNVTLNTSLDLFSNYLKETKNVDLDWKVQINMKVNDYLSANLITHLIYDNDTKIKDPDTGIASPRLQFMESFGVGLTFRF